MIAALVLALAVVVPWSPAAAPRQHAGACTGNEGVTIVVDFQQLGGGVNVVCAAGSPGDGLEALTTAGISFQTAQRFPSFVCRIAGRPADDRCVNASPASAYWGYWLAAPGGEWCYSPLGAGSRAPVPGTYEGWSFSLGNTANAIPPPHFDPPPAPASPPPELHRSDCDSTPAVAATTSVAATTTPATTPTTVAPTTVITLPDTSTVTTTTPSTVTTSGPASTTTDAASTTATSAPAATNAVDLSEDGGDGGSPIGFVVSAAAVIGLAGAGAVIVRRRKLRS